MRGLARVLGVVAVVAAVPAAACTDGVGLAMQPVGEARVNALLNTVPQKITVGAPFEVDLTICASDSAAIDRLAIDATMPAHRHGMNYKPEIAPLGSGRYRAKGFLFHMPGEWEFALSVTSNGTTSVLRLPVRVP